LKVLIAYDSVSPERNTQKAAEAMRDMLLQKGIEAESVHVNDIDLSNVGNYDCIIVGSPTHGWRPTPPVSEFLNKLTPQIASGKSAASFDTRVKSIFAGGAADNIEKALKKLGFKIAARALAVYVRGEESASKELNKRVFKLVDGELEKVRRFAEQAVKSPQ